MPASRPLAHVRCLDLATLLNVCLAEEDLRRLGAWSEPPPERPVSAAVWSRATLHRRCREDEGAALRVSDLLDLRYLDTVLLVRGMQVGELERLVDLWVERPDGHALPGLLWALQTDPRCAVHALGARLGHEAVTAACQALVAPEAAARR